MNELDVLWTVDQPFTPRKFSVSACMAFMQRVVISTLSTIA